MLMHKSYLVRFRQQNDFHEKSLLQMKYTLNDMSTEKNAFLEDENDLRH